MVAIYVISSNDHGDVQGPHWGYPPILHDYNEYSWIIVDYHIEYWSIMDILHDL